MRSDADVSALILAGGKATRFGGIAKHLIVIDGETFALHLLPSGILTPGVTPVIANGVVIDAGVLLALGDLGPGRAVGDLPVHQQHAGVLAVAGHGHLRLGRERLVTLVVGVEDVRGATAELLPVLERGVPRRVGEAARGGTPQHSAGGDQ